MPERKTVVLLAACGFFLITLDILIVNLALPRIARDLGGGTAALQWVIDGYTLLFAALLLFAGNLSDRVGANRAFTGGVVLFGVASVLCAAAPAIQLLIAARCIQGAGAALMLPGSMALVREAFPEPERRAHALGVWAAGGAVAAAAGPLLGGLLTTLDWRLVFAINIPVCAGILAFIRKLGSSPRMTVPFDWAGQLLAIVGLAALIYGLIEGGDKGFSRPETITELGAAVLALSGFIAVQAKTAHPMMPLALLRPSGMRIALLGGFAFMFSWFGTVFLASLYLQQHLGLAPWLAGLAFLPSAAVSLVGNLSSGLLTNRLGTRFPAVLGLSSITLGLIGLAAVAPLNSPWPVVGLVLLVGAGGSVAMPPLTGLVLSSTRGENAGIASAIFNTFRQIGGAVAIAVFGVLIASPRTFTSGLQTSFVIAAVLSLVAVLAGLGIRPPAASTPNP